LSGGVVNAASGQTGEGLAPGSYISIFGRNLSDATKVFSTPYLPLSLAGVSVSFDEPSRGISVPGRLTYVSEGQINVQLPWELAGLNAVAMKVSIGPLTESALFTVPLKNHSPALFEIADPGGSGRQVVAALDETNQVLSSTNPARRGRVAQLYANGLGPVDNTVPSGEATLPDRLSRTLQQPEVTIGGAAAPVQFSGLAPSYVGLYQVNVTVPQSLQPGMHEVVVSIGGVRSKPVLLYVN
jgi:uncharacterized protein (TIGR03437 family)